MSLQGACSEHTDARVLRFPHSGYAHLTAALLTGRASEHASTTLWHLVVALTVAPTAAHLSKCLTGSRNGTLITIKWLITPGQLRHTAALVLKAASATIVLLYDCFWLLLGIHEFPACFCGQGNHRECVQQCGVSSFGEYRCANNDFPHLAVGQHSPTPTLGGEVLTVPRRKFLWLGPAEE